jgi:hypothetical protein
MCTVRNWIAGFATDAGDVRWQRAFDRADGDDVAVFAHDNEC